MKTLYLVRHGKAEEKIIQTDFSRKLLAKGVSESKELGIWLKEKNIQPDIILSSHAPRAFETAKIIYAHINPKHKIKINKALYEIRTVDLIKLIKATDASTDSILIVGHNPSLKEAAKYFSTFSEESFKKSAVAAITFDQKDWSKLKKQSGQLLFYIKPSKLVTDDKKSKS